MVLLLVAVGGGGIATIGGVVTGYIKDRRVSLQQDRSVAIDEVDRAIPGLGEIIKQLRAQIAAQSQEIERLNRRNQQLVGEAYNLERRVEELERELGNR